MWQNTTNEETVASTANDAEKDPKSQQKESKDEEKI